MYLAGRVQSRAEIPKQALSFFGAMIFRSLLRMVVERGRICEACGWWFRIASLGDEGRVLGRQCEE
jgi:hypothetical protein